MLILLIASYVTIPSALSLLCEYHKDFMILTPDKNIFDLMKIIYGENKLLLFDIPQSALKLKNAYDLFFSIRDINRHKKMMKKKIKDFKNCDVYFDLVANCEFEFWLVKTLSTKNNMYYLKSIEFENIGKDLFNFKANTYYFLNRIIYRTKLQPCLVGLYMTLRLTDAYLKDVNAVTIKLEVDYKKMSEFVKQKFSILDKKILLLCGGVADIFVSKENYIKSMDEIISTLIDKFGIESISIKAHPRYQVYLSKENGLNKLPTLLPASLLLNNFEIVIGYSSTAIAEASHASKKVYSLLKYMRPIDSSVLKTYINYLEINMDKTHPVFFPENIEELKTMLDNKNEV
jgi:hypothetical protein